METFSEIFQAMVHDHGNRPRNHGKLDNPTHHAEGVNPLTGDKIDIDFQIDDSGLIRAVSFEGKASALATTSASVMTSTLSDISAGDARNKIDETLKVLSGDSPVPNGLPEDEYSVLLEIRNFPHRILCAALAWKTAATALKQKE